MLIKRIVAYLRLEYLVRRRPIDFAQEIGVRLGRDCRLLGLTRKTFGSEPYLVQLGDHVSLTGNVRFITHDGGVWIFRDREPNIEVVEPIVIGNNVFIGLGSTILPGVHVGDNCVIGAGSVVNRDIPADSVAAGCPAKVVSSVEDYWKKTRARALYCGDLPESEKRIFLEKELSDRFHDVC